MQKQKNKKGVYKMKKNRAVIGFLFFLFIFNFYICAELNQRPDNTYFEKRRQALMDKMEGGIEQPETIR